MSPSIPKLVTVRELAVMIGALWAISFVYFAILALTIDYHLTNITHQLAAIQAPRPVHTTATAPMPHKRPLLSAAGGIGEVGVSEISEREIRNLVGRK